jgi:Ran GTPase-activating protein (RanGAP) involved in mRNA processing and transport
MSKLHQLASTYAEECAAYKLLPNPSLLDAFNMATQPHNLIIKGNEKQNFHNRVKADSLFPIVTVMKPIALNITIIDLRYNDLQDDGATKLCDLISSATNLKELNLRSNSIGVQGAKNIRSALKNNSCLEILDISHNSIKTDGSMSLIELLFAPTKLIKLDIGCNEIDHDGVIAITSVLNLNNNTLQDLNLDSPIYHSVAQEMCIHIGKMLASNNGIRKLSLQKHKFRCDGLYIIAEHLLENTALECLDLRSNEIGVEGCQALGKYLTSGKCILKVLHLSSNRLGDLGAKAISGALESNKSLQILTLNYNRINDAGLCYLSEGIDVNSTLRCITLFGNFFGQKSLSLYNAMSTKRKDWETDFKIYTVDDHLDIAKIEVSIE